MLSQPLANPVMSNQAASNFDTAALTKSMKVLTQAIYGLILVNVMTLVIVMLR